jgi:hypothetical protein
MSIHASIPSRDPSSARGGRSSAAITIPPESSAALSDIEKYCIGVTKTRQRSLERADDAAVVQIHADAFSRLPLRKTILAAISCPCDLEARLLESSAFAPSADAVATSAASR